LRALRIFEKADKHCLIANSIRTERTLEPQVILCLQGRLVNGETEALRNALESASNTDAIVLDLARVSTIDARGLGVMLELREVAHTKGIDFRIMNVTKLVSMVLEITCLNSVFEISSGAEVLSKVPVASALELERCA